MNYFIVITGENKSDKTKEIAEKFGIKKKYIYDKNDFENYNTPNEWICVAHDLIREDHDIVLTTDSIDDKIPSFWLSYFNVLENDYQEKERYFNILVADKNDSEYYPDIFDEVMIYEN